MRRRKDVTRCVCGSDDNDGMMIQCENSMCRVWQHVDCMGLSTIPEMFWGRASLFQSKSVASTVQGSKVVKKRQTMNSRQLDFEMGFDVDIQEVEELREPTPPPPPKPKKKKEQLKKIRYMLDYFEQLDLPEFCKEHSEHLDDEDCCQDCYWEDSNALSGSLIEVQTKVYHALLRYQLQI